MSASFRGPSKMQVFLLVSHLKSPKKGYPNKRLVHIVKVNNVMVVGHDLLSVMSVQNGSKQVHASATRGNGPSW